MNKTALISLMSQAPIKPNWFEGKDLPLEPRKPFETIVSLTPIGTDIEKLIREWFKEDCEFDLWDVDLSSYDFLKVSGLTIEQMQEVLKEFSEKWEKYWKDSYAWKKSLEILTDIQWRVYWAKEALKEIEKGMI